MRQMEPTCDRRLMAVLTSTKTHAFVLKKNVSRNRKPFLIAIISIEQVARVTHILSKTTTVTVTVIMKLANVRDFAAQVDTVAEKVILVVQTNFNKWKIFLKILMLVSNTRLVRELSLCPGTRFVRCFDIISVAFSS